LTREVSFEIYGHMLVVTLQLFYVNYRVDIKVKLFLCLTKHHAVKTYFLFNLVLRH